MNVDFWSRVSFRAAVTVIGAVVCVACTGSSEDTNLVTASALSPGTDHLDEGEAGELSSGVTFFCGDLNHPKPGDSDCVGKTITQVYGQNADFNLTQVLRLFGEARDDAWYKATRDGTQFNPSDYDMFWPVWLDVFDEQSRPHTVQGTVLSSQLEFNWDGNFVYVPVGNFAWPDVGPIWVDTMWVQIFDPRPKFRNNDGLCWAEFGGLGRDSSCEAAR